MKRFWYVLVTVMMVLVSSGLSAAGSMAQLGTLPPEDLILRIDDDEQWRMLESNGEKHVREYPQLLDGVPQTEVDELSLAYYEEHNVQTVYVYSGQIRPVINNYEPQATGVEMRILTFENEADAVSYHEGAFDNAVFLDQENRNGGNQLQLMDQVLDTEYPTVGWTYQQIYVDGNGNEVGRASALRFLVQHGSMLVSVRVQGPFVDFNFDLGFALIEQQMACVVQNVVCDPVTLSEITPGWRYMAGLLFYLDDQNEGVSARFIFPVEEPVRWPEMGVAFEATAAGTDATSGSTSSTRTTRTSRTTTSGDSSGSNRSVRTTRSTSSGDSSGSTGVTRTTRTTRTANTSTNAEPTNASVIVSEAVVYAEPDTNAAVLATLSEGDRVTVTGDAELVGTTQWVPVMLETGEEGWMLVQDVWKD